MKGDLTTCGRELPVAIGRDHRSRCNTEDPSVSTPSDVVACWRTLKKMLCCKVLRGPIFRCTDEELFTFAEIGGRFNISEHRPAEDKAHTQGAPAADEMTFGLFLVASYMRVMVRLPQQSASWMNWG